MAERGFKEICVGNFVAQPGSKRWPNPESPHIPQPAPWRSNLVALSQKYNLYFAAYQEEIHVAVPRGLQQTISSGPDLILALPISENALRIGGYIDATIPHAVNNIRIGNLGNLEIILIACDDGDIIGYYTHLLWEEVQLPRTQAQVCLATDTRTKSFFHENVGISSWSLAIHEKSRLLAVGSNNREVTVFAPGFSSGDMYRKGSSLEDLPPEFNQLFPDVSSHVDSVANRLLNFKIVLPLGPGGHNIPSIDFVDNTEGFAEAILATDINGNLWKLGIWDGGKQVLPRIQKNPNETGEMGWGVLSIPLRCFRTVSTPADGLGITPVKTAMLTENDALNLPFHFDIGSSIPNVKQASISHPLYHGRLVQPFNRNPNPSLKLGLEDDNGHFDGDGFTDILNGLLKAVNSPDDWHLFSTLPGLKHLPDFYPKKVENQEISGSSPNNDEDQSKSSANRQHIMARYLAIKSCFVASDVEPPGMKEWVLKTAAQLKVNQKKAKINDAKHGAELLRERLKTPLTGLHTPGAIRPTLFMPDGSAIFQTFTHDIQLCPPCPMVQPRTVCRKILKQYLPHGFPNLIRNFDRLNMLTVIPELSLVVIASQIGRVALITLTKLKDNFSESGPVVMCRLDLILPLSIHEHTYRPIAQLLGFAVSPLQTKDTKDDRKKFPRRWRLMLHYFDHTILSYELSREDDNALTIF